MMLRLDYQPPYRFEELLAFFGARALADVEVVDETSYRRTVHLPIADGGYQNGWVCVENDTDNRQLVVTMVDDLAPLAAEIERRLRQMFDIESDPQAIARGLSSLPVLRPAAAVDGVRLPGCFDPFETACRAVLGQQISVKAAGGLARRIVETYGDEVETGISGLTRAWPSPRTILALDPIEDAFGALGVIRTRSRVIFELAQLIDGGELDFTNGDTDKIYERLLAIRGIGPWTAGYISMRALAHPDVFLETDAGIVHALPDLTPKERRALVEPCRPWRSYAVISLWNSLAE